MPYRKVKRERRLLSHEHARRLRRVPVQPTTAI